MNFPKSLKLPKFLTYIILTASLLLVDQKKIRVEEKIMDQQGRPMALVYLGDTLINQTMLE